MPRLLPAIADRADFARARDLPTGDWLPALRALAARHGLPDGPVRRFGAGEHPVFSLGEQWVIKLVPGLWRPAALREIECLRFLAERSTLPVAQLVADGQIEDWHYLVSVRLPGTPLDRVWPQLSEEEKFKLADNLGEMLQDLHHLPVGGLRPGGIGWEPFCGNAIAAWANRRDAGRLPPPLRADAPRFLTQEDPRKTAAALVLLHGDLAPENALVTRGEGGWRFSGIIDFGNALAGDALFDFAAPTVLLAPGDAEIVRRILTSYSKSASTGIRVLRRRLMALTLIHPLADLPDCLALFPGADACPTWDAVAERFWPD